MNAKTHFANAKTTMSSLKAEKPKIVRNLDLNSSKLAKSSFMNLFKTFYQRGVTYIKKKKTQQNKLG